MTVPVLSVRGVLGEWHGKLYFDRNIRILANTTIVGYTLIEMTLFQLNWNEIDDVLLDMDGTLLDRHFDNFFFEEELPRRYAALHGLQLEESRDTLMAMYRSVEGELAWTDLHYWTQRVGIDVVP